VGSRLSTGGGEPGAAKPDGSEPRALARRRLGWYGACVLIGLPFSVFGVIGPPWTFVIFGAPLLLIGWLTRPLSPLDRLCGFAAFSLGAGLPEIVRFATG
jgi:hypothetical protein